MREFTPKVTFCHSCKYWAEAVMNNCVDPYGEYFCPYDMVECDENNSKFELMRDSLGKIWAKMDESEIKKNIEAINQLSRNKSVFKFDEEMTEAMNRAIKALEFINANCPSLFVDFLQEKNTKGKWIATGQTNEHYGYEYRCSECGETEVYIARMKFCPYCGAALEIDKENENVSG